MKSGADPLLHYMTRGFAELRQPSLLFDIRYYVDQVPEVQKNGQDPLLHFLCEGWHSHKRTTRYFDPLFYIRNTPEVDFSHINPFLHYLEHGSNAAASMYFDAGYYREKYSDVPSANEHPLHHYLRLGVKEKRQSSLYFDSEYYYDNTPGLREIHLDPLTHYFSFGIREGKSPSPLFDPQYYAQTYSVAKDGEPFAQYLKEGLPAGQRPCRWFDPEFYCQRYLPVSAPLQDSLKHYLERGVWEGLYPNRDVSALPVKPVISLIVPVYNVSPSHLNRCIRSVFYQSYPHWELCFADDCSTRADVRPLLEKWAAREKRIKIVFLHENSGISGATNAAAALATGSYLGFLDNDDELAEECLYTLVEKINEQGADLYYSDEDLIGEDGTQFSVFRKPDYNPQLLLCHNYITHLVVTARTLFTRVGGFDSEQDGAQDYDLFLKLSEQAERIVHIPEILYHWRASQSSTSINHEEKSYADEAGRKALENTLRRRDINGKVDCTDWKFYYRVQKELSRMPLVSVIIYGCSDPNVETWFSDLVSLTSYSPVEYLLIPDEAGFQSEKDVYVLSSSMNKTVSSSYNKAVRKASGEYVVFLDQRVRMLDRDWLEALLEHCLDAETGAAGGRILPGGNEDSAATVPDLKNSSPQYYSAFVQECSRHMNGLQCTQNVIALSWDLLMVERRLFLEIQGFKESVFSSIFADIDLCFRMHEKGYKMVYTPYASGQREGKDLEPRESAVDSFLEARHAFQKRWQGLLSAGDPYYNYGVLRQAHIGMPEFLVWVTGKRCE